MELKATRFGYGEAVVEIGKLDENVVVLSADVTTSVASHFFQKEFPDRFFNIGIAEQNMICVAGGLALANKIPFVSAYSLFATGRPWDQIRNTVAYSNLNVKIVGSHSGLLVGPDGATHQALEDIAIMRTIPNMKVIVPCDFNETKKAVHALHKDFGPAFLRVGRAPVPNITDDNTPFEIGKMNVMRQGNDVAIFSCGYMLHEALKAAEILEHENIKATVVNVHTIKPLDEQTLVSVVKNVGAIVTAEEHQIMGGMGSAILEVLARECPTPVEMIGMQDKFGESGEPLELLEKYGLTKEAIILSVKKVLERK